MVYGHLLVYGSSKPQIVCIKRRSKIKLEPGHGFTPYKQDMTHDYHDKIELCIATLCQ